MIVLSRRFADRFVASIELILHRCSTSVHLIASDQIASDLRLLANVVHLIASDRIVALDCDYCERNICKGFVLDCEENIPSDSRTYVYLQESHIYFQIGDIGSREWDTTAKNRHSQHGVAHGEYVPSFRRAGARPTLERVPPV